MLITINIKQSEIQSAIALSREANTRNFARGLGLADRYDALGMSKAELVLMFLGRPKTISFTKSIGKFVIDGDIIITRGSLVVNVHTDMRDVHATLREVYRDPESFKSIIISVLQKKEVRRNLKDLRWNIKGLLSALKKLRE